VAVGVVPRLTAVEVQLSKKPDLDPLVEGYVFYLVQHSLMMLPLGMVLDGGQLAQSCIYGMISFWIGYWIIRIRRPKQLHQGDRLFLNWGPLVFPVISSLLTHWIWHLRGY
jgi:hypothetical protein